MTPEIIDCQQGSPEWHTARCGIITASCMHMLFMSGRGGAESKTRRSYLLKLAGERLTGEPLEAYTNGHMERGKLMEQDARDRYALFTDTDPQAVGFIRNNLAGGSPDSLVGNDGVLEIKTKLAALTIECLLKDEPPPEHIAQCQGMLWVSQREWCDLVVYWPKLPWFCKRIYRDSEYIEKLEAAVIAANEEIDDIVERIRRYGQSDLKARLEQSLAELPGGGRVNVFG